MAKTHAATAAAIHNQQHDEPTATAVSKEEGSALVLRRYEFSSNLRAAIGRSLRQGAASASRASKKK